MLKSDLVRRLAAAYPHLHRSAVEAIVATILETMAEALARGDRVELRDFCALSVKRTRARVGRNPRTGAEVVVDVKAAIQCKPGRNMVRRMNPGQEILAARGQRAARPRA